MAFKSVPKITEWIVVREKKTGNIISVRKNLFKPIRHELYVPKAPKATEAEVESSYVAPSDMTSEEELAKLTEERAWLSKDAEKKARYYELKNG